MNLRVLSKEESDALVESMYKERIEWTTEQIIADAKFGLSLPGTKYILTNQYEAFYKWLETEEAREQWNSYKLTLPLARYFNWKYCQGLSDEEINDLIKNQVLYK